jgi:hypothetical protein
VKPTEFPNLKKGKKIVINEKQNSVTFDMMNSYQDKESCGPTSLIGAAILLLQGVNKEKPSKHTAMAITKLEEAFMWLKAVDR